MSLRRSQPTSVKDTATIDFKEGFFQSVRPETGAMESLKNEIAELRAKLDKPMEVPVQTASKHHQDSHRPDSRHGRSYHMDPHQKSKSKHMDNYKSSNSAMPSTSSVADAVMAKLDHLESKLKPESNVKLDSKTNVMADAVMAKLDHLESKLKPETNVKLSSLEANANPMADAVMAKLDHLESKLAKTDVMDKLATLESKLTKPDPQASVLEKLAKLESKLSAPKEAPHLSVLSKLDEIERKLQTDGKFQAAMSQIDSLKTQMASEQSVKEAVFTKLAKLEEQVKVKNSMPVVTLEDYNKEQAKLRKLEAMRSKLQ